MRITAREQKKIEDQFSRRNAKIVQIVKGIEAKLVQSDSENVAEMQSESAFRVAKQVKSGLARAPTLQKGFSAILAKCVRRLN